MSNTYRPRVGSLAEKVIAYLRENPGTELTKEAIDGLFGVSKHSVYANLETAVQRGALTMTRNEDLEYVYRAGTGRPAATTAPAAPAAPAWPPVPPKAGTPAQDNTPRPGSAAVQLPVTREQIEALEVETGIPLGTQGRTVDKWDPLFAKLTQPDTSVRFPARWKSAVAAQATKRNRRAKQEGRPDEYKVRIISTEHARIWRLA